MKLIKFKEQNCIYAENQPEYLQLPAYRFPNDVRGEIVCCWKLDWKERVKLLFTGEIWHSIWTFNKPLQPQLLSVNKPFLGLFSPQHINCRCNDVKESHDRNNES